MADADGGWENADGKMRMKNKKINSDNNRNDRNRNPYNDKKRGYTVTRRTEMSHTKPKLNATNGIRTTVAKWKRNNKRSK